MIIDRDIAKLYKTKILHALVKDYDHETPDEPKTKAFAKLFKEFLVKTLKGTEYKVHSFKGNWKDASGFITAGPDKFVYISCGYGFSFTGWQDNILIRLADHTSDYSRGQNHYTTMDTLKEDVIKLIERGR